MDSRRRLLAAALALLVALTAAAAASAKGADYPVHPVTIIVPASAGSGPDVIARIVADRLGLRWKTQVLIVNHPGAGGLIGMQAAAAVKPDGYTFYMPLSSTFIVLAQTRPNLPLDLLRDFVPIAILGEQPMIIAANPKLGVNTLSELVALAKAKPEAILYGTNIGSLPNMTGELLQERAGIKLGYIPYASVSKATQDTIGGTLHVVIESFSGLSGPIKSGLLRPLAVASDKRVAEFADIPTVAEAIPGVQDFEARGWFALMAPAGTPPPILRKVSDDVRQVLSEPELQAKFASLGTFTRLMPETGVAAYIRKEQALWLPIVKRLNASH